MAALSRAQIVAVSVATKAAQTLMRDGFKLDVLPTGHWGSYSQRLYASLTSVQKQQVNKVISAYNADLSVMVAIASQASSLTKASLPAGQSLASSELVGSVGGLPPGYVWEIDLFKIIAQVSAKTGIEVSVLKRFLVLECPRRVINGKGSYNAAIRNSGGYSGLFQFDKKGAAWSVASKFVDLGPFETSWMKAEQNTLAAAGYILANTKTIRGLGYKGIISGSISYLMHNQGASGAWKLLKGGVLSNKQSALAQQVVAVAQREYTEQRELA